MSTVLWTFAAIGYLGIGTVIVASMNHGKRVADPLARVIHEGGEILGIVFWLPLLALMGCALVMYYGGAIATFPLRWLYCRVAGLPEPPMFLDGDATPQSTTVAQWYDSQPGNAVATKEDPT